MRQIQSYVDTPQDLENFKTIVQTLNQIKEKYQFILRIDFETQERLILTEFCRLTPNDDTLTPLYEACRDVLAENPDRIPHDNSLTGEVQDRLPRAFHSALPHDDFDRDMVLYPIAMREINTLFAPLHAMDLPKPYAIIIEKLERVVTHALINNPNFKGDRPYYKRHVQEYNQSKTLTCTLLDGDFDTYVKYFSEA